MNKKKKRNQKRKKTKKRNWVRRESNVRPDDLRGNISRRLGTYSLNQLRQRPSSDSPVQIRAKSLDFSKYKHQVRSLWQ